MNFRRGRSHEEPEINLIPLIDVLLVILIFLMVTTTYSKFSGLEINLPTADAPPPEQQQPNEVNVVLTADRGCPGQSRAGRCARRRRRSALR